MSSTDSRALGEPPSCYEFGSAGILDSPINLSWSLNVASPRSPDLWEWSLDRWDLPNASSRLPFPEFACSSPADTGNFIESSVVTSSSSSTVLQSASLTSDLATIFSDKKSPGCRESCYESGFHYVLGLEEGVAGCIGRESSSNERCLATLSNVKQTDMQTGAEITRVQNEASYKSGKAPSPTGMQLQDHNSQKATPSFIAVCGRKGLQNEGHQEVARQRAPTKRVAEMELSELRQYFYMPINEASKRLKVGVTVLKGKCREFGVRRWPHRKIKSLDGLIHSIQESATTKEGKANMEAVLIAKELEEKRKLMEARPEIKLNNRIKRLRQASFKSKYNKKRKLRKMQKSLAKEEGSPQAGASETASAGDGNTIVLSTGAPFNIQTDADDSSVREHRKNRIFQALKLLC